MGGDMNLVEHVGVEDAGFRNRSKSQGDDNLFLAAHVIAWKSEQVIKVGCADVDVREDRVDCVRIVVVGHDLTPINNMLKVSTGRLYDVIPVLNRSTLLLLLVHKQAHGNRQR